MGKFRGNSEDWLDSDETVSKAKRTQGGPKKKLRPEKFRANLEPNSTVIEVFNKLCKVRLDGTNEEWLCSYKRADIYGTDEKLKNARQRAPVAVGDRAAVEATSPLEGVLLSVAPRKNRLIRIAPDKDASVVHVVATNVDCVAIVASTHEPEFTPGIVDRFLIAAQAEGIDSVVIINKTDLATSQRPWKLYQDLKMPVFEVSAKKHQGIEDVRKVLLNKRVVFCGHSGVGKTSLLREMLNIQVGVIGTTNEYTGKGKHTTTSSFIYKASTDSADKTEWIDTPGVRAFSLFNVEPRDLRFLFPEFGALNCALSSCAHLGEEGCAALNEPRLHSYQRIHASLTEKR